MNIVSTFLQPFRDFLFTTTCFHCRKSLDGHEERLCNACWSSLRCVQPEDFTFTVMQQRFTETGIVDGFYPLFYFEKNGVFQTLAHNLKYQEIRSFGYELGKRLGEWLKVTGVEVDFIIPVPLNVKKFRERGYNQAEVIARGVSFILTTPVSEKIVRRVRYTQTQTKLTAEQRKINIEDAFTVHAESSTTGKRFLIVDDIITTGATIQEIAKVLKNFGAAKTFIASAGLAKLGEDV